MPRAYKDQSPTVLQRLPEYKRNDEWIRAFLRAAKVGHIASARDDQPFLNPSTFWFDEANHQIVFHSNVAGQIRSNIESNSRVCFEACEWGKMLPSNVALEFSLQFRSVILFGAARILTDPDEIRRVMYELLHKYFPVMTAGREFRAITDKELKRTSVYAIQIEEWSGKENWKDRADQSDEWMPLDEEWLE
jgi:nitroimidazol reductase NimA-like FMN-containing flavoprotein (pyridoxamine 5'-phosphate oxidase superfamily)